jgi:hypothetical protein
MRERSSRELVMARRGVLTPAKALGIVDRAWSIIAQLADAALPVAPALPTETRQIGGGVSV